MKVLKQVLGVDVSQKELVVCLGRMTAEMNVELYSRRIFRNKETGFVALLKWLKKETDESLGVHIVMEATGVYHEKFAYELEEKGFPVSIVLPSKISNYMRVY